MAGKLHEVVLFIREFRSTYHSTGAILPSGPSLARALTRFVGGRATRHGPRRILEVGPGTGAVTREIIQTMQPADRLHLVELNERFVRYLEAKLASDVRYASSRDRVSITHAPVQELPDDSKYDVIISGLPLNNFTPDVVAEILEKFRTLLSAEGTLSFFEYIAIRRAKATVSKRTERTRLQGIGEILGNVLREHEICRDRVLRNVPPAWVHHVRFGKKVNGR